MQVLPQAPCMEPLQRDRHFIHRASFICLSPVDEPSSRFPKMGPLWRCPSPEAFLHILQGPQQGSPPSRFPSQSSHRVRSSRRIWLFTMHRRSWVKENCISHLSPLEGDYSPSRELPMSLLSNTMIPIRLSHTLLDPW